ncbi:MAG TPA: polyprenyl synthetase family protein [Firmicutes bacterium]|nr:polyprenyl synthetase family protein [Bacillota bacterium]
MKTESSLAAQIAMLQEMQQIEERITQAATATNSSLTKELAVRLLKQGGKRLRPFLVVLCASFGNYQKDALVDTAAAAELIHTASLIHDDIIDEAKERRGAKSLNSLWGNKWAVLTGDYLFATAFTLLVKHDGLGVLEPMTRSISLMCEAEIEQLKRCRDKIIPTVEIYYNYIYKKTAHFLSACCLTGALVSGLGEEKSQALKNYGFHLGMAFQIIDDILDLAPGANLGKPAGADLRQRTITLPLLLLLQNPVYAPTTRSLLSLDILTEEDISALSSAALKSGALEQARNKAVAHINLAKEFLRSFQGFAAKNTLDSLADFVLERKS